MTLSVRNFERLQHYKDRRPPWIKFYIDFLDDPELVELDPVSRLIAALMTLIASQKRNRIPDSAEWLAEECHVTKTQAQTAIEDLLAVEFIVRSSSPSSKVASNIAKPRARPRVREEAETERETPYVEETSTAGTERRIFEYAAQRLGHPLWKFTGDRRAKIRARLRDGYSEQDLRSVIDGVLLDPWEGRTQHCDPVQIFRDGAHVDKFLALANGVNGYRSPGDPGFAPRTAAEREQHRAALLAARGTQ